MYENIREEAINKLTELLPGEFLSEYTDAIKMGIEALNNKTPCDLCKYNPPGSGDGKPCTMCPAVGKDESDTDKDEEMIAKIAKANANIEQLIDTVIFYEMKQMDGYCFGEQTNCEIDCNECKERFLENKKIEMMEKYLV